MADPKDIHLVKKGNLVIAKIKVGKRWVDRSGQWRSKEEARGPAIVLRDQLQAEHAAANPEPSAQHTSDATAPERKKKSLRERGDEELQNYVKRQRLRSAHPTDLSSTFAGWRGCSAPARMTRFAMVAKLFLGPTN